MAYMNDPDGRLCDWGILRSECWGVRLPPEYKGAVPPQMLMDDIPEAEYIVFEHGPFDYEQENRSVEERIEMQWQRLIMLIQAIAWILLPAAHVFLL